MTNSWNQNELHLPSDNSRSNSANLSLTSSGSFDMSILNSAMVNPFKNTHKLNRLSLHTHTIHQHRWPMAILNLRRMTSDSVFRCHYKAEWRTLVLSTQASSTTIDFPTALDRLVPQHPAYCHALYGNRQYTITVVCLIAVAQPTSIMNNISDCSLFGGTNRTDEVLV